MVARGFTLALPAKAKVPGSEASAGEAVMVTLLNTPPTTLASQERVELPPGAIALGLRPKFRGVAATVSGPADAACWSAEEQALLALVDDLVDRRTIADGTWTALAAHFDEAQILEAIALVGYYHTISFLCRGLDLPLESYAARVPGASS